MPASRRHEVAVSAFGTRFRATPSPDECLSAGEKRGHSQNEAVALRGIKCSKSFYLHIFK